MTKIDFRVIRQETVDNSGNTVVQYIYRLGTAGERIGVTELNRSVEYTYDSLYRLTSESIIEGENTTVYTYAYDSVSNRILKTENGTETAYVYNSLNQLVSDSETSYEYDLNGNLIRVIGTANSALYEYNAENKLVKATVQNGNLVTVETYTYDYAGNRTSKSTHKSNGEFEYVKYLNDNSSLTNVLAEIDDTGTVKCVYTLGADLVSQERDGRTSFYLYDGHGSVVGLANESGVVTDTYCYDAFGNLLKSTGSTANNYRYCGEQFDITTGLYYLRARYMDTTTGRFISQDSYEGDINDPVSLHKYLYANANPVMYSDPSGYYSLADAEVGTAGETILNVSYQMANQSAMRIGMAIFAAVVTIVDVALVNYIITEYFLDNINNVASCAAASGEANAEVRDGAVDGVPGGKESDDEQDEENDDSNNDALDKLIGSTSPGRETKGRTKQREKNGDMDDANEDFDSLSPSNVKEIPGGRTGELDGDIKVNVRDHSSEGSPTIEIQYPNGTRIKIRYK